jgi:hypothetical protein
LRGRGIATTSDRHWAGSALAVGVLAVLIWRLGTSPLVAGLEAVDGRAVLAAAAIVLATTLCSAWRWSIVARGLGLRLSPGAAVASYYQALFLNLTLPSGVAGDLRRGIRHGREVRDVSRALRAVVWERAAGQVVQAVLTISVLLILPSFVRSPVRVVAGAVVGVALLIVVVGRARPRGGRPRWTRVRNAVATDIHDGVLRRDALPAVVLTSALIVVGHAVTFFIAARAAGVTASISRLLPVAVLALLAMALPNIGGWGPREGVTAWAFSAAGLGAGHGAATAVTFGILVLAASLPGALVLVVGRASPAVRARPERTGRRYA